MTGRSRTISCISTGSFSSNTFHSRDCSCVLCNLEIRKTRRKRRRAKNRMSQRSKDSQSCRDKNLIHNCMMRGWTEGLLLTWWWAFGWELDMVDQLLQLSGYGCETRLMEGMKLMERYKLLLLTSRTSRHNIRRAIHRLRSISFEPYSAQPRRALRGIHSRQRSTRIM